MKKPSKEEVRAYIAEVAKQLAAMCRGHDPALSATLRCAAQIARLPDRMTSKTRKR